MNIPWRKLKEKLTEAMQAVLPIIGIVLVLCFSIAPISPSILLSFLLGAVMIILGIMFFTLGAETSMTPMGTRTGAEITRSRKLWLIVVLGFILGFIITISEPDLQVLAQQVPSIPNQTLIYAVAAGVGLFLVVALLRMLFGIPLPHLLVGFYAVVFLLTLFVPESFLAVAFDSGGVTTGPITVPFIMALGVGIANVLGDRKSKDSSFGLVALCSVGPILAVLVLGIFSNADMNYEVPDYAVSNDILGAFVHTFGHTAKEVAVALGMIVVCFLICQVLFLKLPKRRLLRIAVGVVFTYVGLVIFLTGVNVGFMPIGYKLGTALAEANRWILVGFGLIIGILVVLAEPAIHVLNAQVEDVTGGLVSKKSMMLGLCIGVGSAIALSMIRIIFDFSLVYYIIPGYFISLALSLFVPPVYTAIAFDSGGVASGPMTSGFILPFATGVCVAMQGEAAVLRDAFGVVALVAMAPLITIQLLGFKGIVTERVNERRAMRKMLDADDQQIINFM